MRYVIAALACLAAGPLAAQDFSEGSKAKGWGLIAEKKAKFEAKVVDLVCEFSGDCPADCGAGKRQFGLIRTADNVIDTRRSVPRCSDIPFHISIVRKQFTLFIQCDVVLITETCRDQLDVFSIWIHRHDESSRCHSSCVMSASIRHAAKQVIFLPNFWNTTASNITGQVGVVAGAHQDPLSIGC